MGFGSTPLELYNYQMVWTPKDRFRVLTDLVEHTICMPVEGGEVIALTVQADHIHLAVSVRSRVYAWELMGSLTAKLATQLMRS